MRVWLRIAAAGFADSSRQIAVMGRTLVDERHWVDAQQFQRGRAFCTLVPGPEAPQLASYLGWLQHGVRGALTAGLLLVAPGLLSLLALTAVYLHLHDVRLAGGLLFGLRVAVLALVAHALLRAAPAAVRRRRSLGIAATAFGVLWVGGWPCRWW